MDISQEKLQELVIKALKELGYYNPLTTSTSKKKLYMICDSQWNEKYIEFMENMDNQNFEIYPVIPSEWFLTEHKNSLESFDNCKRTINRKEFNLIDLEETIIVFPIVTKDIIVKTALCISDTFENKCISECIENGNKIVFMLNGLPKFTGKESSAYIKNLLSYYRTILEYNIDISDNYNFINENKRGSKLVTNKQTFENSKPTEVLNKNSKKVITATDLYKYRNAGVIKLNYGDIVTDLAKESAEKMGITFEIM